MTRSLKKVAKSITTLTRLPLNVQTHYSQEGEDIILARIFSNQLNGFFVDVGAHHPTRFSNTYWAYRRGWNGINIEAAPGAKKLFDRIRPRDINLEVCVAESTGDLDFYLFPESALNTSGIQRKGAIERLFSSESRTVKISSERLEVLLTKHLPKNVAAIDFMSIDVEGSELAVLRSNDWERFRPRVIVVEVLGKNLDSVMDSEEMRFLTDLEYVPVSMLYHSVVLVGDEELLGAHWGGV